MIEPHGPTELSDGDEFAGYRIERRLGRGGMGILYLAVEPGLDRRVALKLIAPEAATEEVFAKRFAEESRIAASIEHPNVVPIYAAGEEAGVPFIAMRYVAGSDLSQRLTRESRMEPEQAVGLIAQVANGLDAIHAAGLVHRDVKPANVLLSGGEADHAYITDFGVARNVATQSGLTQTGRFVGTLDYVAPEQISGAAIDARVDVYALGCLLFKLLTGEVPFPREGEAARLYAHLNDPPPAPSLYVPEVSMALDDVVIRAMSKQPDDRYPSAGDLGRAATAALSGAPVTVPEHTVATGAAATVETETLAPVSPTRESPPPTTATGRLTPEPSERLTEPNAAGPKRRPLLIGGALVGILAVVIAAIALSGSSGGGDETEATGATTSKEEAASKQAKEPEPRILTRTELIAKGDAICSESQDKFTALKGPFPNGENEPDPAYSRLLVENSNTAVRKFNELVPPLALRKPYAQYVAARVKVNGWDRDALRAAEAGDEVAYLEARETRDQTAPERERLAEAVGFKVCSQ
jgi:serine/threonine protein kinase